MTIQTVIWIEVVPSTFSYLWRHFGAAHGGLFQLQTAVVRNNLFPGQVSTFAALAWTKRSLPMPAKVSECSCGMLWCHVCKSTLCRTEAEGQRWKISISSWYSQGGLCIGGVLSQALFGDISRASTYDRLLLMIMVTSQLHGLLATLRMNLSSLFCTKEQLSSCAQHATGPSKV